MCLSDFTTELINVKQTFLTVTILFLSQLHNQDIYHCGRKVFMDSDDEIMLERWCKRVLDTTEWMQGWLNEGGRKRTDRFIATCDVV